MRDESARESRGGMRIIGRIDDQLRSFSSTSPYLDSAEPSDGRGKTSSRVVAELARIAYDPCAPRRLRTLEAILIEAHRYPSPVRERLFVRGCVELAGTKGDGG